MLVITKDTTLYLKLPSVGTVSYYISYRIVGPIDIDKGPVLETHGEATVLGLTPMLSGTDNPNSTIIENIIIVNTGSVPIEVKVILSLDGKEQVLNINNILGTGSLEYTKQTGFILKGIGPADVSVVSVDRYGTTLPTLLLSNASPNANWNTYNFTPLALSREVSWSGDESAIQTAADTFITNNIYKNVIGWYPNRGGTANCHKWNMKYPYDDNRAHRMIYNAVTHDATGLVFNGFVWAYPNINLQSFTNTYGISIGIVMTSHPSSAGDGCIFEGYDYTGINTLFQINRTTGLITYRIYGAQDTYTPGAVPSDYTGKRYFIAREGTAMKLYIDGVMVKSTTPSFSLNATGYPLNNTLKFGGHGYGSNGFTGSLGNIIIATDLTEAQIITMDGIISTLESSR